MRETLMGGTPCVYAESRPSLGGPASGVAWLAAIGGAFAAAGLTLILLALGSGSGLASVSPWSNAGASATTFTLVMAVRTELPLAALTMALQWQRQQPGLIHHHDRGGQYASGDYRRALVAADITPSMSRKGNCWDAAMRNKGCYGEK
jgi:hypothetical protein